MANYHIPKLQSYKDLCLFFVEMIYLIIIEDLHKGIHFSVRKWEDDSEVDEPISYFQVNDW